MDLPYLHKPGYVTRGILSFQYLAKDVHGDTDSISRSVTSPWNSPTALDTTCRNALFRTLSTSPQTLSSFLVNDAVFLFCSPWITSFTYDVGDSQGCLRFEDKPVSLRARERKSDATHPPLPLLGRVALQRKHVLELIPGVISIHDLGCPL